MEQNEIYAVENPQTENGQNNRQKANGGKYFYCGLITGLAVALVIVSAVYLVNRIEAYQHARNYTSGQAVVDEDKGTAETETAADSAVDERMLQKLKIIETVIDKYYYQEDVDREALANGAYKGMVEALGDPYSEYYTAEELVEMYQDSEGLYYGIGAYVSLDTTVGIAKISGVMAGTPAEEAKLREEDLIYKVDGTETYGMSLQEVVKMIKGEEGTYVHLTLIRDSEEIEVDVVRRLVEAPTVNYEMFDGGLAYIQITQFDTVTVEQFENALIQARADGMKGMILDLRSNPGGLLSSVVNIARMMLPEGMIVYTEDRDGNRDEYRCDGSRQLEVPLVVLVNGNSASASEILAGAIKDYGIGTLLGTTTYGKGIVQRPVELTDGSAVKLTISSYFTPNGNNIHGIGIEPDEVYEFDGERYYSDEKYDNQKERAKDLLRSMLTE